MKRQAMNYVANCIPDLKKGVENIEKASRIETLDCFCLRVKEVEHELAVMREVVTTIQHQQELEIGTTQTT